MNAIPRIAAAAIALFAAAGSIAAEGTQEYTDAKALSSKSRAEVVAELKGAPVAFFGEASPAPLAASTLERVRIAAEGREALRLGLIGSSEVQVAPTAAQLEQVRVAGERAVATRIAAAK